MAQFGWEKGMPCHGVLTIVRSSRKALPEVPKVTSSLFTRGPVGCFGFGSVKSSLFTRNTLRKILFENMRYSIENK